MIAAFIGLQVYALRHMDTKFAAVDRRFDDVDRRFAEVDRRFGEQDLALRERFEHHETLVRERFDHQEAMLDLRFGALEHRVAGLADDMKLVKAHLIPPAA